MERDAGRNVELMWLLSGVAPDFRTIADFKKAIAKGIRLVCRYFVLICRKLDLFKDVFIAIDGSKFKAVNSRGRNHTLWALPNKLTPHYYFLPCNTYPNQTSCKN